MVKQKIEDIQALRGIAIILVITCHLSFSRSILNLFIDGISVPFYIGVDLFFMISGFVVTNSVLRGNRHPVSFIIRRAFRLLPVLITGQILTAVTIAVFHRAAPSAWALNFFSFPWSEYWNEVISILTGTFINPIRLPVAYSNGAMWSLSVEFQFYAFFCALLSVLLFARRGKVTFRHLLTGIMLVMSILCAYARFIKGFGFRAAGLEYLVHFRFDFMSWGVLLATFREKIAFYAQESYQHIIRSRFKFFLLILPLLILCFCREDTATPDASSSDYRDSFGLLFTQLCFLGLMLPAVQGRLFCKHGSFYRMLCIVGEYSYVIYVIHFSCMAFAWLIIFNIDTQLVLMEWPYAFLQLAVTLFIITPIAYVVHRFVETPMNKLGHSLSSALNGRQDCHVVNFKGQKSEEQSG